MSTLYLDTETYSECDLPKRGAHVYARDPSTECLLLTYALDDGPVQLWDVTVEPFVPDDLERYLADPQIRITAHNSSYDKLILDRVLGLETALPRWRCTMVKAYTMGLPGQLAMLSTTLGLSDDLGKMAEGKRLIRKFCMPQPANRKVRRHTRASDPEDWEQFRTYAVRDTEALREIDRRIPNWNYRGQELALWHLDQRINERGLPIDLHLARKAARLCDAHLERLNDELQALTGGVVTAHSKRDEMLAWLAAQGVSASGYTKADVSGLLERDDLPSAARRALEIRREAGRTSTAKYVRFGLVTNRDGRLRGGFQYAGAARTMRWAGRMVQPQNFPRPTIKGTDTAAEAIVHDTADLLYDNVMDVAASCIRAVIAAKPGHKLIPGDYANIEGRMLAWLAGEDWKLQAFRDFDAGVGADLYRVAYAKAFGVDVDDVDDDQRFIGKTTELACGYQGGLGAFQGMARNFGAELPDDKAMEAVYAWRAANPEIVRWWYTLEQAALHALKHPGKAFRARSVSFCQKRDWLLCQLPSGRFVPYYKARPTRNGIRYQGLDQKTRRWVELEAYGGKFAENITQAASRDVMAHNMPLVEEAGYPIVGTVHDEIIPEVPDTDAYTAAGMEAAMGHVPPWAEGLPLAVKAYETYRYRKD